MTRPIAISRHPCWPVLSAVLLGCGARSELAASGPLADVASAGASGAAGQSGAAGASAGASGVAGTSGVSGAAGPGGQAGASGTDAGGASGAGGAGGAAGAVRCQPGDPPLVLATVASPYGIALDDGFVYATQAFDSGGVVRVSKDGGPATVLASQQGRPYYLALDATAVYFTTPITGQVVRVDKAGGAPVTLATFQHFPAGIVAHQGAIYWVYDSFPAGALMQLPPGGTVPVQLASLPSPSALVQRDESLFMVSNGAGAVPPAVLQFDLATATLSTLAESEAQLNDLAVSSSELFYTTNTTAFRLPAGGSPVAIGTGVFVDGITASNDSVYYVERGTDHDGRVRRWSALTQQQTVLASQRDLPRRVVVDDRCVYWTEGPPGGDTGAIVRAPR